MARGGLKKDFDRRKKSLTNKSGGVTGANAKDPSLLESTKDGIFSTDTAILNTHLDISGSVPTERNGYGDVIAKYHIDSIASNIDASLTQTRYENETFEKVLDISISELLPSGGGMDPREFFANYEELKDSFPAYAAAASHEYLYSSSLSYLAESTGAGEAAEIEELVAPEITVQPIGPRTVSEEIEVILGPVIATGLDLKYQWRKDGSEIPNETFNSLTISSTSEHDIGIYTCQITNDAGAVLSSDVKLEIVPLYSSGLVESNIIENGGGEKGVTGWTPTVGEVAAKAWQQTPAKTYPDWEAWDGLVAEQYPYLQVVDGGEIYLWGGENTITIAYQDIDLKPIEKGITGKVEGVGGFRYVFYGWLGGHEQQEDFPRCKVEWFDSGNTILDTFQIEMIGEHRKTVFSGSGSDNTGVVLTGFGNERNMFEDEPVFSEIADELLTAVSNSFKTVPSGARKVKVSMIMDRVGGGSNVENSGFIDNLSLVMVPMSSDEISDAEAAQEAAEEAELEEYIQSTFDWQDPTTYTQAPAPTYDGEYDGEFSREHEDTHPSTPGEWRWTESTGVWTPAYLWTGASGSSGHYTNVCFTETALVFMADGKYKRISKIKEGDKILTFDEKTNGYSEGTVTEFLVHEVNRLMPTVELTNKEFDYEPLVGDPAHPIYHDKRWAEIQESKAEFKMSEAFIDNYYNLEVDGHNVMEGNHNYIVNGYIVSGLGDNPILNRFYQRQNIFKELEKKSASII